MESAPKKNIIKEKIRFIKESNTPETTKAIISDLEIYLKVTTNNYKPGSDNMTEQQMDTFMNTMSEDYGELGSEELEELIDELKNLIGMR